MVSISCIYFFSMYGHFERIEFLKEYVIKLFFLAVKPPCATTSRKRPPQLCAVPQMILDRKCRSQIMTNDPVKSREMEWISGMEQRTAQW